MERLKPGKNQVNDPGSRLFSVRGIAEFLAGNLSEQSHAAELLSFWYFSSGQPYPFTLHVFFPSLPHSLPSPTLFPPPSFPFLPLLLSLTFFS